MAFQFRTECPINGLSVNYTEDKKYNVDGIIIRFITPLDEIKSPRYNFVCSLLAEACRKYPEKADLIKRTNYLYGSNITCYGYRLGKYCVTGLSIMGIADSFTMNGETISVDCAQLLLDCLLDPDISDGRFNDNYFEQKKHTLISRIASDINNRHMYAISRARQIAFKDEPMAYTITGTAEHAEKLTNEDAVNAYYEMLNTSFINLSFVGRGENKEAQKLVLDRLTDLVKSRSCETENISDLNFYSSIKDEPAFVSEEIDQTQSKLVIFYKSDCRDVYANEVACSMFGGTPFSKLFANVREKLSLCYYCQSAIIDCAGAVIVDSGVEKGNEEKARDEIFNQLESLKNGDFTDEELENTKKYLRNATRWNYDAAEEMNLWYFFQYAKGIDISPEEYIEKIDAVTRQDVIDAVNAYRLDTVYTLIPDGGEADE